MAPGTLLQLLLETYPTEDLQERLRSVNAGTNCKNFKPFFVYRPSDQFANISCGDSYINWMSIYC